MKFIRSPFFLFALFALAALAVSMQSYYSPLKEFWGGQYTSYNNYLIFKQAFHHLVRGQDLYLQYPQEYADYYKYSPTFALLFAPLALLPDVVGLGCWNLLNALVLLYAFFSLGQQKNRWSILFLVFLLVDTVTSMQSSQSNALMAGLVMLAFAAVQRERYLLSVLLIALGVYIKLYAGVAFLFIFMARAPRKFFLYACMVMGVLLLLPVVVTGFDGLWWQYRNWWRLLAWDLDASAGTSLMGIAQLLSGTGAFKLPLQLLGVGLMLLPLLLKKRQERADFGLHYLVLMLLWMVLFNHKAESPSFVIAFAGATLWIMQHYRRPVFLVAYLIAFTGGCLSSTDIFPPALRHVFIDIHLKAFAYLPLLVCVYSCFFTRNSAR